MSSDTSDLPTFDALPLTPEVRRAVDELGYVHPTPVQLAVFEPAARGKDLVVQARTGTGKTAAFGLPIVDQLVRRNVAAVQALVLCPTRELALQVTREFGALAKHRGVKCTPVYGGAPMPRQIAEIKAGAQVVIGTPGRVLDHLHRQTIDPSSVRQLVLDESDEMLSMGFLPQITDILSFLPANRQTLLFSATLPADIRRMAETRLKNPTFVTLSGDHIGALSIVHLVYVVPGDKLGALIQVVETENPESAVVFCNTKDETKRVAAALEQQGYAADWLNADLAQNDREKVMDATRRGVLRFLVATDVASRGIDISHLTHVINFDFPESAEAYVHRTGRTGRAGRTGVAISLVGPRDVGNLYMLRLTYKLKPIERQLPSAVEKKTRQEADLLRMFVEAFVSRKAHADDLALARRVLTHDQAEVIVAGLLRDHLGVRPDAVEEATAARRARGAAERAAPQAESPAVVTRSQPEPAPREPAPREPAPREPAPREPAPREPAPRERAPRESARDRRPPRPPRTPEGQSTSHANDEPDYESPSYRAAKAMAQAGQGNESDGGVPTGETDGTAGPESAALETTEIYVSVGRRDGAKPSDYQALLQSAGLTEDEVGYVRVRHRHAFVGVKGEAFERALDALDGAMIANRKATAELARRS
jgi:ATP-dependent RNA helicase DeaD